MSEIFLNNIFAWLIVLTVIGLLIYTLKIIGNEKVTFLEDCYYVKFHQFQIPIPNWWALKSQNQNTIEFHRADTRYDWYARFTYHKCQEAKELTEVLKDKLNLESMEFDADVIFETDSRHLFKNKNIQEIFQEMIRVEGKATVLEVDRIYYDIVLLRELNKSSYYIFESKSSVLNGLVEGPYFEEALKEITFDADVLEQSLG